MAVGRRLVLSYSALRPIPELGCTKRFEPTCCRAVFRSQAGRPEQACPAASRWWLGRVVGRVEGCGSVDEP